MAPNVDGQTLLPYFFQFCQTLWLVQVNNEANSVTDSEAKLCGFLLKKPSSGFLLLKASSVTFFPPRCQTLWLLRVKVWLYDSCRSVRVKSHD